MKTAPATAAAVRRALRAEASPGRAKGVAAFFKTGPGEYGEGDVFMGVTVPAQRKIARGHRALPMTEIGKLLASKVHEERLTALLILTDRFERGEPKERDAIFRFYLRNLRHVNNWDLVDTSAATIVGGTLLRGDRRLLQKLGRSKSLWERRVAIIATFAFIKTGESSGTFAVAAQLMADKEDLLHKAVGWMLREVGKRVSEDDLRRFLREHAPSMPRTALRYAIERFSPTERKRWLAA